MSSLDYQARGGSFGSLGGGGRVLLSSLLITVSLLHISTLSVVLMIVHVAIEIYLKSFLGPRQILNKSMKSHGHCAFICEGFGAFGGWGRVGC